MHYLLIALAISTSIANAQGFSGYARVASNYIWRGMSDSENEPQISLATTYEHTSGVYGSLFGSNLHLADATLFEGYATREMDLTLGYKKTFGNWTANAWVNRYEYLDQPKMSAFEYSVLVSRGDTSLEYDYMPDWFGYHSGSHYFRLSQAYALTEKFNLVAGIGYNRQEHETRTKAEDGKWTGVGFTNYVDYFAGLQVKEAGGYMYEITFSNTNRDLILYNSADPASDGARTGAKDLALTVSFAKSF